MKPYQWACGDSGKEELLFYQTQGGAPIHPDWVGVRGGREKRAERDKRQTIAKRGRVYSLLMIKYSSGVWTTFVQFILVQQPHNDCVCSRGGWELFKISRLKIFRL